MVKVYGPAMSLDASGTIGKAIVFSKWKGRHYIRERIVPANPRSGLQVGFRAMFKFLAENWAPLGAPDKASYETLADSMAISPFNAYIRANQRRWRNYKAPSRNIAAPETGDVCTWNGGTPAATGGPSNVTLAMTPAAREENWGVAIFRSTGTGFTPGISNCVAVLLVNTEDEFTWVDSPLTVDTYYYDTRRFTVEGLWGALDGEINAAST
ncbi:unnamed protein product [marine sediment metagenome]|uniref:Uncharacterized protein n=1 Tax=marine sediment metagenome TaxID=412755 RepID=X0XEV4_9ZZZZ